MEQLLLGLGGGDIAYTVARVATGLFFFLSGYHKLFNQGRHETLVKTLEADGVHEVAIIQWAIPSGEFLGGLALIVGFLTVPASIGLMALCVGACVLDGFKRIPEWKPLDLADWLDDVLYLPEAIYVCLLMIFTANGGGRWSVDWQVALWLVGA